MKKRALRLCAAVFGLALVSVPAAARTGCPWALYWPGDGVYCSWLSGSSCEHCTYYCTGPAGQNGIFEWNLCDVEEG